MSAWAIKLIRTWLTLRLDRCPTLWIGNDGERLSCDGLRSIIRRLADRAGVRPNTITTWMRYPAFIIELRQAEQEALEKITRQMLTGVRKLIGKVRYGRLYPGKLR